MTTNFNHELQAYVPTSKHHLHLLMLVFIILKLTIYLRLTTYNDIPSKVAPYLFSSRFTQPLS